MDELYGESELFADLYNFVDYGNELFAEDPVFAEIALDGLVAQFDTST